ncbi:MAG: HlyD family efflux transporter periplasmic adaptor subunit [Alphaproteobacteria bacterium]|nr:HlyD family efflux transporter periplasmic adaptor subunit [Alphaproteobacteria bacterium]
MTFTDRTRAAAGLLSMLLLVLLGVLAPRWGVVELRGVVEPSARFTLMEVDGQLRWTLRRGVGPAGLRVESEGLMQLDRGELASLELAPELVDGQVVEAGALLLLGSSARIEAARAALLAEWDRYAARRDLLLAGGRVEAVRSAQEAVDVAAAALQAAEIVVPRLEETVRAGAGARADLQDAQAQVEVRKAELDRARAELALARLPARPEQLAEAEARLATIEAQLAELDARADALELRSPISGVLVQKSGDVLLEVISQDRSYARIPLAEAERARVSLGDSVRFRPAVDPSVVLDGQIVAIAPEAVPLEGQAVIWLVAELPAILPPGSTGAATLGGPLG